MPEVSVALLPGDGIGPEVVAEAVRVIDAIAPDHDLTIDWHEHLMGGISIDAHGTALTDEVLAACAGFALLKEARFALVARIGEAISVGHFPIAALVDSARTVIAGLFLIFPGIISDFIAITLLLLPRPALSRPFPAPGFGNVVDGQFRRER